MMCTSFLCVVFLCFCAYFEDSFCMLGCTTVVRLFIDQTDNAMQRFKTIAFKTV